MKRIYRHRSENTRRLLIKPHCSFLKELSHLYPRVFISSCKRQFAHHDRLIAKGDLVCPECKARGIETEVITGELVHKQLAEAE